MALSATQVAFEGFRIVRDRPLVVLTWAALHLVFIVAMACAFVGFAGPTLVQTLHIFEGLPPGDPKALTAAMTATMPTGGALQGLAAAEAATLGAWLVVFAVLDASIFRAVLRPQDRGVLGLKLGADELRQLLVLLIKILVLAFAFFLGGFVTGLVVSILNLGGPALGGLGMAVGFSATMGLMIWLTLRLSLLGPMTLANRRIDLWAAWRLTKGHLWRLLGAYLFALLMAQVVSFLCQAIYGPLAVLAAAGNEAKVFNPLASAHFTSFEAFFTPQCAGYLVFGAFVSALTTAIITAAAPKAYAALSTSA